MTTSFIYLNRSCPVCNGARKDCRQSTTTNLIHCRDSQAHPLDYAFRGEDALGFGIWAHKADVEVATQEKQQQWRRKKQLEQQQQQQRIKKLLSIEQRHQEYSKLNTKHPLSRKHRQQLQEIRNLTAKEIDFAAKEGLIATWNSGQQTYNISLDLAGINPSNGRLLGVDAIAVAATDEQGRITGYQLAPDDREKFGRYIWLSSAKKGGNGPQLPNGERPLFIRKHPKVTRITEVWIVEGALKSLLVALPLWFRHGRTDIAVIGCGGNDHAGSKQALEVALTALNPDRVVINPDAGAIANKKILENYQQTKDVAISCIGNKLAVTWWGQVAKAANRDIDELLIAGEPIPSCISWEEFTSYWQVQPAAAKLSERDREIPHQEWEIRHGLGAFLKKQYSWICHWFKGFEKEPERKPNRLAIAPDKVTETETLLDSIVSAVASGKKHILIHSDGGQTKSHTIGLATPEMFGVEKLLYFSDSGRNPTTPTIEANFVAMPVRNNGLKVDPYRKTPLGNPRVVWPQRGEQPDLAGNCSRTSIFHTLAAKHLPAIEGGDSPICLGCPLLNACRHSTGKGYGFRHERRLVMQADRIRLHIDSSPSHEEFNYSNTIGIFDEAGVNLRFTNTVEVNQDDIDKLVAELVTNHPSLYVTLQPYLNALRPYLTGELKQPYHGWSDSDLRAALPALENDPSQLIEAINEAIAPNLSFLDSIESIDIDLDSMSVKECKQWSGLKRRLEKASAIGNWEAREEINQSVLKNWLPLLLEILAGRKSGALRCQWGKLTITTRNERHTAVVDSLKAAIYLDGALSREELALRLQCQPEEIHVIEHPKPDYSNLKIFQITGMGHCGGKAPSETMQLRKAALRKALSAKHKDIVFTDFKVNVEDPENDGCWFVDSRGSNRFAGTSARCTFGTPVENLGSIQVEYIAFTGKQATLGDRNKGTVTAPQLQAFIDARTQGIRLQDVWRQRSHRYREQQFVYYAVTDDDLSFLQEELPGVTIEQLDAFSITPKAGNIVQQTRWGIVQAFKFATEQGLKLTQKAIADVAGISAIYLRKIAAQWGGWQPFKKAIQALLNSLNSACIAFSDAKLDQEEGFFRDWLPTAIDDAKAGNDDAMVEAIANIASIPKILGFQSFRRVLEASTLEVRAEALGLLLAFLPPQLRESVVKSSWWML